jgi:RNA polymerase sigma factor (sigma-70 family)
MGGTKFLEEHILLSLLRSAGEDETVPKIVYDLYYRICTPILREVYGTLNESDRESLLEQAFAEFWDQVESGRIHPPLKSGLIHYFLSILEFKANRQSAASSGSMEDLKRHMYKYSSSEALLELIKLGHRKTENEIYQEFKPPIINLLKRDWHASPEQAEFVCNPAIAEAIKSFRNGKPSPPLEVKLYTYIFRIARNQWLNRYDKEKRNREDSTEDEDFLALLEPKIFNSSTYLDELEGKNPWVKKLHAENNRDLLEKMLNLLTEEQKRYIIMHRIEGRSYEEIQEILAQENDNKSIVALRKAVFDGLKKLKNILNSK